MDHDQAIEVEDLTKVYPGEVRALQGVSFGVRREEIFGYLGRNGAGKTTTVRILATLVGQTSGRALVEGRDVEVDPAGVRSLIGVAMQDAALDDLMTAREHLELVSRLMGFGSAESRARSAELLEAFGLADAADRLVATYSGGMRRRLDVAMALVHRPPILFLDEPTTGLDPQSRRAVWAMIRAMRDEGATILLTTQYLEEADELSDRVAIVHEGRIAAIGTPGELKAELGSSGVKLRLRGADPDRVRAALADGGVIVPEGDLLRLELSADGQRLVDLLVQLREQGAVVEALSVLEPTLEDVFVRLTGEQLDASAGSDAAAGVSAMRRYRGGGGQAR